MAGAAAAGGAKTLHIIHFNDVYELPARSQEPVGGAARFCGLLKACEAKLDPPPLVLFSGDAYNPSLLSTITKGRQMVEVLNHCGVHAACIGNHDFDYGWVGGRVGCEQGGRASTQRKACTAPTPRSPTHAGLRILKS